MVAFDRPKGYRGSYIQHQEQGVPPTVVFEILSPGNRKRVMDFKRNVYEMYGIEEYYVFDPYKIGLEVWLGEDQVFRSIPEASGWVSPRLGIRFELAEDLTIYAPDGRPFLDYAEVATQRDESDRRSEEAMRQVVQVNRQLSLVEETVEAERLRAGQAEQRAGQAEQRAGQAEQRAEAERLRAERLAAKLRELGLEPED